MNKFTESPTPAGGSRKRPHPLAWLLLLIIFGTVFTAGARMLWQGGNDLYDAARFSGWTSTEGTIIKRGAEILDGAEDQATASLEKVRADLLYRYDVGDQTYTGTRLDFGRLRSGGPENPDGIEALPPGKSVVVHYDPQAPQRSVLRPLLGFNTFLQLFVGLAFVGFALFIAWLVGSGRFFNAPKQE